MIELLWAIALEADYRKMRAHYPHLLKLGFVRWRGYLSPHRAPPASWGVS